MDAVAYSSCPVIGADRVRQLLTYDPHTGVVTRKVRTNSNVQVGEVVGCPSRKGYLRTSVDGRVYMLHRLVWLYHYGTWPEGEIDHINGIRADNRIANLRDVTSSENNKNRRRPITNRTGFMGVYWSPKKKKWLAEITTAGKKIHLGFFEDIDDAAKARKDAELCYGFHPNHGI